MVFFTCLISFFIFFFSDRQVNNLMLLVRAFLHCLLSGLVSISSCFLVRNIMLLMWACSFVDLHCIVVHALEHVLGERDSFMLDHVIELYQWLNNIQMITWLKLWCIHTSSWFSFDHYLVWPFLLHLSLPAYHPFLESHERDSQWDIFLGSWTLFWRFHNRILMILSLQIFPFFWWCRSSKILIHYQFFFHHV